MLQSGSRGVRRDVQPPHPFLHNLHRRFLFGALRLDWRCARATVAPCVTAAITMLVRVLERCPAFVAIPPCFRSSARGVGITGIPFRVLLLFRAGNGESKASKIGNREDLRITRAFRATSVLAVLALNRLADKECLTLVAGSAHTLSRQPSCHLLPSRSMWHADRPVAFCRTLIYKDPTGDSSLALGDPGLGAWVTRAFLAAGMVAVAAELVLAKRGLATMTGAANPHTNRLLYSRCTFCHWNSPLARLQSKPIFGKQSFRFLLLQCASLLGSHACTSLDRAWRRLAVFDGLSDLSWYR